MKQKPWFVPTLIAAFVVGWIGVSNSWDLQTKARIKAEAARYGVSAEEFEAACLVSDEHGEHLELPTDPDIIAAVWARRLS